MKHEDLAPALAASPAERLYMALCRRLRSTESPGPLSWCHSSSVDAVAVDLDSAGGGSRIELWLGKKAAAGDVPRRVRVGAQWVDIRVRRYDRPAGQLSAVSNLDAHPHIVGKVAALVRDRFDPDGHFILSCGHVLGGSTAARFGNRIEVVTSGGQLGEARLVQWAPVLADDVPRVGIDAGIARIGPDLIAALRTEELPSGIASEFRYDDEVILRRDPPVAGFLKTRWSGYLDIIGSDRTRDYFLENAIGYQTVLPTEGGDSGTAVWTAKGGLLAGIHVGAPIGDERWRSNAIFCPIDKIMDWFDIEPCLNDAGTGFMPADAKLPPPRAGVSSPQVVVYGNSARDTDIETVAQTLWGEARGEGREGMAAVACVIGNRLARNMRGKTSLTAVCLDKYQFSCWNPNDPNLSRLDRVRRNPDESYRIARELATQLIDGQLDDMTSGATHYYADSLRTPPYWAVGLRPCFTLGRHVFFNNVK